MDFKTYCKLFRTDLLSARGPKVFEFSYGKLISASSRPIPKQKNHSAFNFTPTSDKDFCVYCGIQLTNRLTRNIEHLIPKSRGGNNTNYNRRHSCIKCNSDKGSLTPQEYLLLLKCRLKQAENESYRYEIEIAIENTDYIVQYVESAGFKVLASESQLPEINYYKVIKKLRC